MYWDYAIKPLTRGEDDREIVKGRIWATCQEDGWRLAMVEAIRSASKNKPEGNTLDELGYILDFPHEKERQDYERWGEYFGPWAEWTNKGGVIDQDLDELFFEKFEASPTHVVLELLGCKPLFELL